MIGGNDAPDARVSAAFVLEQVTRRPTSEQIQPVPVALTNVAGASI